MNKEIVMGCILVVGYFNKELLGNLRECCEERWFLINYLFYCVVYCVNGFIDSDVCFVLYIIFDEV